MVHKTRLPEVVVLVAVSSDMQISSSAIATVSNRRPSLGAALARRTVLQLLLLPPLLLLLRAHLTAVLVVVAAAMPRLAAGQGHAVGCWQSRRDCNVFGR